MSRSRLMAMIVLAGFTAGLGCSTGDAPGPGEGEGEGEECEPATIDLVTYDTYFSVFLDGCGCTERFIHESGCASVSGGDSEHCECLTEDALTPSPSLTLLNIISDAGETAIPLESVIDDGGRATATRRPHGAGPVTFRFAGCWGEADLLGVGAADAPLPSCDSTTEPVVCEQADGSAFSLACHNGDIYGTSCCFHDSATYEVATTNLEATHHVQSVFSEGTHVFGSLTVRVWRVGWLSL